MCCVLKLQSFNWLVKCFSSQFARKPTIVWSHYLSVHNKNILLVKFGCDTFFDAVKKKTTTLGLTLVC